MSTYDYSCVTDKGFIAFLYDLDEGAWKDVSIKRYDTLSRTPLTLLIDAPRPVAWKLRVTWSITTLKYALGSVSAELLDQLDAEWDSSQRALDLTLSAAMEHRDAAHRRAATSLRQALLAGNGDEQTGYSYDAEVDFGRRQRALTSSGPLAEDTKTVGIVEHLHRIHEATEALARGLGRTPGQPRSVPRVRRVREALAGCAAAFTTIHDEIRWLIEHTPEGEAKKRLHALHAPFLALLDRYLGRVPTSQDSSSTRARGPRPSAVPALT
jgi:hypothetical protein